VQADLVLTGGAVFRSDPARSWAEAVAVAGQRIVAVGGSREMAPLIGPGTEVIDLDGRLLCAGFQDAHVHPASGGLTMMRCNLLPFADRQAALAEIARYAAATPDGWVRGGGWHYPWFEHGNPSAELLDRLVGDRPAYLGVADGHSGWASTRALAMAGIDASTPDPPDGRIERLPDGRPQGTLHEGAMDLMDRAMPPDTEDDLDAALLTGQDYLLSLGITAWQDAWVEPPLHAAYVRLAGRGQLRATVRGSLWWERGRGDDQIAGLVEMRAQSTGRYTAGTVKLMLDGVCENFTAAVLAPYLDGDGRVTHRMGIDMIDRAELPAIVTSLVGFGFQPHFHAIGDAAVRSALDAVEAAFARHGRRDVRPHIAHIQVVDPVDVPRFRSVGVAANAQPLWACAEAAQTELTIPFLGPERARHQYPFGDLLRHGATLAMGSDWSVSTPDVMAQAHVAVTRQAPATHTEPFLPKQRLGLADVLAAFTAGSAYVNHVDADRGAVSPGMIADLVVLDRNPFEEDEVWRTQVDLTVLGGEIVYRRRV